MGEQSGANISCSSARSWDLLRFTSLDMYFTLVKISSLTTMKHLQNYAKKIESVLKVKLKGQRDEERCHFVKMEENKSLPNYF